MPAPAAGPRPPGAGRAGMGGRDGRCWRRARERHRLRREREIREPLDESDTTGCAEATPDLASRREASARAARARGVDAGGGVVLYGA